MTVRRYDIYDSISWSMGIQRTEAKQMIRYLTDSEISDMELKFREHLQELENKYKELQEV